MSLEATMAWLRTAVAGAELPFSELVSALEPYDDEAAQAALCEELARLLDAARATVTSETTARLDAAFAELAAAGILARHHAGTTPASGWKLVRTLAARRTPAPRGAVFYHERDLEAVLAGKPLRLSFGAIDPDALDDVRVAIGREVVAALARHGLAPAWSGAPRDRLELPAFAWARARHNGIPPLTPRAIHRLSQARIYDGRCSCAVPDEVTSTDAETQMTDRVCHNCGEVVAEMVPPWFGYVPDEDADAGADD